MWQDTKRNLWDIFSPFVGHPHEAEMNTAMVCTERWNITVILLEDYTAISTMQFLILQPFPAVRIKL